MYDELISYWARQRPDSVAVALPNSSVSYAEFDDQIDKVTQQIAALHLPAGTRVALYIGDDYIHWLLMLAFDRLGLATISIANPSPEHPVLAALRPDLLVTSFAGLPSTRFKMLRIDKSWFDAAMARPTSGARPHRPAGESVRFISSTGTTGAPKLMALTRAAVEARVESLRTGVGITATSRGAVLLGLGTAVGTTWCLAHWASGGGVAMNLHLASVPAQALRQTRPSHVLISPAAMLQLVQGPSLPPMPSTALYLVGGMLPPALAAEARRVLTPDIGVIYGASEIGSVAIAPPELLARSEGEMGGVVGRVHPAVEVQVLDEAGRMLTPGTAGLLRAKGPGMASGYLDGEASGGLRDGWFYPGDLGEVSADGLVTLRGRLDELINIAGSKFAPHELEAAALDCAGIRDAAAFSVPDERGVEIPWVAVVRGEGYKPGEVLGKLRSRWPALNRLQIAVTKEIPRNQMGKIDRLRLREYGQAWKARSGG
jgi:acyl-CoA synthetase (AMP-forming)/AMP-acid ligase II